MRELPLHQVDRFCEVELSWADPEGLRYPAPTSPAPGWVWHRPDRVVTGPTWGGNLEILHWTLAVGRWIRPAEDYAGCVLILETSEEMPSSEEVFRMLRNMGERGLLAQFPAVVFGTAKATSIDRPVSPDKREPYRTAQRDAVLRGVRGLQPRGDDRLQRGLRPHRPAVGAPLRRHADRRRPGPHHHRVVLAADS